MKPWLFGLLFAGCVVLPVVAQQNGPATPSAATNASTSTMANPWLELMNRAVAHAKAHGAAMPVLSPIDSSVVPGAFPAVTRRMPPGYPSVPVAELERMGVRIYPWTTNEPDAMRAVIQSGVDGLISDRPDLLQRVLAEERAAHPNDERLKRFVVSAHRGGRGLRPENTLPSFENGLDLLATELETDTGVSTDNVSLISHDQFFNPQSCRHADGSPYTLENRTYLRDLSSADAQKTFVCDKVHSNLPEQKNDLALSPVSVAFAARNGKPSPYAPTYAAELFHFAHFYAEYYTTGAGKNTPHAAERAANARTVRFNIETKLYPEDLPDNIKQMQEPGVPVALIHNHTREPQAFVDALAGTIQREHMEDRCVIQSFDFRTLLLVTEQYPKIPTSYLTQNPALMQTAFVPASLR